MSKLLLAVLVLGCAFNITNAGLLDFIKCKFTHCDKERTKFAQCYHCSSGSVQDLVQLIGVYGHAEDMDSMVQSTRVHDDNCGRSTSSMRLLNCSAGCMVAELLQSKAILAGCARDGVKVNGNVGTILDNQQFRMALCTSDGCNANYETAVKLEAETSTPSTTTTTTATTTSASTAKVSEATLVILDAAKTVTIKPASSTTAHPKNSKKPNTATSGCLSAAAMAVGLAAMYYVN